MPMPMIMAKNKLGRYDPIWDMPGDETIPIDAAGTGALLVHRSVLEAMRAASAESALHTHEAGLWCWFRDMPVAGEWVGEDVFFCKRAQDLGFNLVAATGARLGHRKGYWVTDRQFTEYITGHRDILTARHTATYEGVSIVSDTPEDRIAELKAQLTEPGANVAAIKAELTRLLVPAKETATANPERETA